MESIIPIYLQALIVFIYVAFNYIMIRQKKYTLVYSLLLVICVLSTFSYAIVFFPDYIKENTPGLAHAVWRDLTINYPSQSWFEDYILCVGVALIFLVTEAVRKSISISRAVGYAVLTLLNFPIALCLFCLTEKQILQQQADVAWDLSKWRYIYLVYIVFFIAPYCFFLTDLVYENFMLGDFFILNITNPINAFITLSNTLGLFIGMFAVAAQINQWPLRLLAYVATFFMGAGGLALILILREWQLAKNRKIS